MASDAPAQDTIRILVATDNHVGYQERDAIRKDDSWKTFDEIMNLARTQDVDMVLLGGDLFHDNKPSRKSMYQVMRSLRKNCLGMKPCELEFLSDANEVFEGAFPHINYEDPDMNISIPVFSIHGNHDDPSGDGHYCSLDLLQVAGLVNYFGRVPEVNNIQVKPVLLQKGRTKLALYGISNVRDERLFRTFRDSGVAFFRPTQQASDFFNLLTVHQNHHAHTSTSYLPEDVLPDWMNLVVWGHEHECVMEPKHNPQTGFDVIQPGSSVATSLIPAEAVQKQVAVVSITGTGYEVRPIPLKTVRPFVQKEIVLREIPAFAKVQAVKNNREKVTKLLILEVESMIEQANRDWLELQDEPEDEIPTEDRPLPLIRLKVEHTADEGAEFDVENPQRFSNRFVGRVANINDVVAFYRKKKNSKRAQDDPSIPERVMEAIGNDEVLKPDVLVREFLAQSSLKVLPKNEFMDRVVAYVNKSAPHIMEDFLEESLSKSLKAAVRLQGDEPDADIDSLLEIVKKYNEDNFDKEGRRAGLPTRRLKVRPDDYDSDLGAHWGGDPSHWYWAEPEQPAKARKTATRATSSRNRRSTSDEDVERDDMFVSQADQDDFPESPQLSPRPAPKRGAAAKKAPAKKAPATKKTPATRGRARKTIAVVSDEDDEGDAAGEADAMSEDAFMDMDEEADPPAPPPKRATRTTKAAAAPKKTASSSRATKAAPAARTRQSTLNFSQSQRQKTLEISADEIDDDDDSDDPFESVSLTTRSRRR